MLPGFKNKFEDGDQVIIKEVKGMHSLEDADSSINGTLHTVKVINTTSFKIGNTLGYSKYDGNGLAKQVRVPVKKTFKTLEECNISDKQGEPVFDQNFLIADFEKMQNF